MTNDLLQKRRDAVIQAARNLRGCLDHDCLLSLLQAVDDMDRVDTSSLSVYAADNRLHLADIILP